uniref:Uncharacterized protein n=1 Tax=Romanomermis culicivorax TaxID=13658 RepID=A0A915I3I4_ROMCU
MNNSLPDHFKFDGKVRYKPSVSAPTYQFKDGCWILALDPKTNRWFLIAQTSQFDQVHKLCKLSLETVSSVPCTAPSGNCLSLSFQGKCVDIKTDNNETVKQVYKTIQSLVSSQKKDFKLSNCAQPMLNRHNVVNGRSYSSHCSVNSPLSNESRKKKLSLEDAQQLILQDSPEKEKRSPIKKLPPQQPTTPKPPHANSNR